MDTYLLAAMQAVASLRSPVQSALDREADAIKNALEIAALTGTFPQLSRIPSYSQGAEVLEAQRAHYKRVEYLVGQVVHQSRESQKSELDLLF
jgi:hypothetical protein